MKLLTVSCILALQNWRDAKLSSRFLFSQSSFLDYGRSNPSTHLYKHRFSLLPLFSHYLPYNLQRHSLVQLSTPLDHRRMSDIPPLLYSNLIQPFFHRYKPQGWFKTEIDNGKFSLFFYFLRITHLNNLSFYLFNSHIDQIVIKLISITI